MSTTYVIHKDGETREFDDEQQFADTVDLLEQNGVDFETETDTGGEIPVADGDEEIQTVETELVEESTNGDSPDATDAEDAQDTLDTEHPKDAPDAMDVVQRSLSDPLETLPGWMKTEVSYSDRGDSSTTINKRGCEVIANFLGLEPSFDVLTSAEETDFEYAYHSCTVETEGGKTFTGYGVARADGKDQAENDGWKLEMMAQTRAYKRAVKFATGDGIAAFVEAQQ